MLRKAGGDQKTSIVATIRKRYPPEKFARLAETTSAKA